MGSYLSTTPNTETDLTGRVAIVTGANRGIGYGVARRLYELGATVYLGCRTESKAIQAIERIRVEVPSSRGQLKSFIADMSTVKKAKQSAKAFLAVESQLDILVHNAAVLVTDFELNEDGIDSAMGTNHFAPFAFTHAVMDTMKQTSSRPGSDVRIISVSSAAQAMPGSHPVRFADEAELINPFPSTNTNGWYNRFVRYGRSKLANILFASELQRRLDAEGSNIIAISLHPGGVTTDGAVKSVSGIPYVGFIAKALTNLFGHGLDTGALNTVFAAADPVVRAEPEKYKGKYLMPVGKVTAPSKLGQDEELAKRLWDLSEKFVESKSST